MSNSDVPRRTFLTTAALGIAAGAFESGEASAETHKKAMRPLKPIKREARVGFDTIKQIDAGELNVGYVDVGPTDGTPVLLLHGWPYDIYSFVDVAPALGAAGYRVLIPFLRGYGTTRFLSESTPRNGQQAAFVVDALKFLDALKIDKALVAGFDWGGRTACALAALYPERFKGLVAVSGYTIASQDDQTLKALPPEKERDWWYIFYFATERGRIGYTENTRAFVKMTWELASPKWHFDDATFDRSASSFENPDHVAVTISSYRWRLKLAEGEDKYAEIERRLAAHPPITVPSITMEGDANGALHAEPKSYAKNFSGPYQHRNVTGGIGHNFPQEAPSAFVQAIMAVNKISPITNATGSS
ncbi:alpha/beta fold hydrolase [Sphingomonas sp. OK281]|uniref:alpha/beta fold hydrolase n=1 Tax=Sphingomonas sp. OK281 TaxID=1881067 RepID=UPI0008F0C92F|nr:alpha/beta hydrolase [Sphingomonas sp. OK281]SFO48161.1 Pimeloyl-ACP methyl ester carboxylesterase [Sphingomonas sp. OK281]